MTVYQKVVAVFGMLRNSISQKAGALTFATKFTSSRRYYPGRLTVYDNVLYICTESHMGAWDASHFMAATADDAISLKSFSEDLATAYDDETVYSEGDIVVKNGRLVECTTSGTGSFATFTGVTVADLIKRLSEEVSGVVDNASSTRDAKPQTSMVEIESIAPAWVSGRSYKPGFVVSRDGKFYCCIEESNDDEWDPQKWTATTIADVIEGLTSAMMNAIRNARV